MTFSFFLRASSVLLSISLLSACSGDSDSGETLKAEVANCEISGQSYGIVGGSILSTGNELSSSTVMVLHKNYKDEISICTGTLIDKDKVLTAAHCTSLFGGKSVIAFSNNASCVAAAPKRTLRVVTNEAVHKDYSYWNKNDFDNSSADLAIMKFSGGLPEGYKVRELPAKSFSTAAVDELVMAGYGVTSEKAKDSGTLRFTTTSAANILGDSFHLEIIGKTVSVEKTVIVEQPIKGVCTGDSGGPLYVKTKNGLTLIGITSMGADNKARDEESARVCHGVALFTDVREHLDWILEKKNSL